MFDFFKKKNPFWPPFSWPDLFMLIGGLGVYIAIASATISKFSIWFDEAFGSYLVRFNVIDITRYTANDVHPPFYYWLLKVWTMAFGNTEVGIRSMSIFFGVLTILLIFLFVLRFFGRRAAYVSLLFLVISPMFIRYGQEARMYTLLTTIIVAATYVLVYAQQSETKKRWPWIVYGTLVAIGMLTQYFAALAWIAHWVWRLSIVRATGDSLKTLRIKFFTRDWVIAHSVAFILFVWWLPFLLIQFFTIQGHGFWIKPITSATIPDFLTNYLLFSDHSGVTSWLAFGFYFILIALFYIAYKVLRSLKGTQRSTYQLIVSMTLVPGLLLIIASMPPLQPAFVDRYLIMSIVFLSVLVGISLVLSKGIVNKWLRFSVGIVIVALMIGGIATQMRVGNYNKSSGQSNNVRQLLEAVRQKSPSQTPIIANSPWIFYEASIYNNSQSPIYFVHETTQYKYGSLTMLAEDETFKIRDVDAFDSKHKTIWMIANLKEAAPYPLRKTWKEKESIIINDSLTGAPLFKAIRFNVE